MLLSRWACATVLLAPAAAQSQALTPGTMVGQTTVSEVEISPSGDAALYTVRRPRTAGEGHGAAVTEIWHITDPCGVHPGEATRIGDPGSRSARWSPTGTSRAWIEQGADGISRLMLLEHGSAHARPIARSSAGLGQFRWSPDGKKIAFTARPEPTAEERATVAAGNDQIVVGANDHPMSLHVADLANGSDTRITTDVSVSNFGWSPDSAQFVIVAAPSSAVDDRLLSTRLFVVPAAGGALRNLVPGVAGPAMYPRWSPDGKTIAWLNGASDNDPFSGTIYVAPAAGGTPVTLTGRYDGSVMLINWLGSKRLLFSAFEGERTVLKSIDPISHRITPLAGPAANMLDMPSASADGRRMAVPADAPDHPAELFCGDPQRGWVRATFNNPELASLRLGKQEIVSWTAQDGTRIGGMLVLPPDYREGVRYPTIVYVHGGSEMAQLNGWYGSFDNWGQMMAGQGFAVLYPNYRGSIGRGPSFAMGEHDDVMGRSYGDITSGLDFLVARGIADPERVGIGGYSWGGLAAAWGATFDSGRYKAAYVGGGISNWLSHSGTSVTGRHDQLTHWNRMLYAQNYQLFLDRSPIAHVGKANTPTLILHSEADRDVPVGQAYELYSALRWKNVPSQLVVYPDEGHVPTSQAHRIDSLTRIRAWFSKYLVK